MTASRGKRRGLQVLFVFGALLFAALGVWQVERLAWKRDLIARVDARVHAAPIPVPGRQDWAAFDSHAAEYTRVHASGLFLHDRETLVDALTELGPGAWVLTPLQTDDGVILVNRGFVPPERREAGTRVAGNEAGQVVVNGLLRASEPHGRFLRPNKPAEGRWFSRDVVAIARAQRIAGVAPFFIDAEAAAPATDAAPRGGLTVVRFRNAHLVYALTWFGLAILCITGLVMLRRISRT